MIPMYAIFVACTMNLLHCIDLPARGPYMNPEACHAVVELVERNQQGTWYIGEQPLPVVMGKCRYWIRK